jgi:hypothetical protein
MLSLPVPAWREEEDCSRRAAHKPVREVVKV